jgi:hypothetical protein
VSHFDNAKDAHRDSAALAVAIAELADLPSTEYVLEYKSVARKYQIPADKLDKLVRDKRKANEKRAERAQAEAAIAAAVREKAKAEAEAKAKPAGDDSDLIKKLRESAKELIDADSVISEFRDHLTKNEGYAGDTLPAERTFVALCSRYSDRPINVRRYAPSGSGKSFTVDVVLPLFDEKSTYFKFSASSEKALIYEEERRASNTDT